MIYTIRILAITCLALSFIVTSCKEIPIESKECKDFREAIMEDPYRANYRFTVTAIYKGDTLRVLTYKDQIVRILGKDDSAEIASLIINENHLILDDSTAQKVVIVKPHEDIDTIIHQGKEKTIEAFLIVMASKKKL